MNILVINSGSSSLKFQLFDMPAEKVLASGLVERIGIGADGSEIHYKKDGVDHSDRIPIRNHEEGLKKITALLLDPDKGVIKEVGEVAAIGHRVVHGGKDFTGITKIDQAVKDKIRSLFSIAPLHNPPNLTGIEVAEKIFPHAVQVAVFDTAFHQSMPQKAYQYALPKRFLTEDGIRVYGFHGTSHQYVSERAKKYLDKKNSKLISIHLGNGCSMTAVKDGKSIDTSMGFTPSNGLVMGTRVGDIDQGAIFFLMQKKGLLYQDMSDILNKQSGMLGLTGKSDLRDIEASAKAGDEQCQLALEINAYRIKKYIGSFAAALNGLDAIIFTAGIGENSSLMRKLVCENMDYFGIQLDPEKNNLREKRIREINTEDSQVKVLVIPTDEELEIARQVYSIRN